LKVRLNKFYRRLNKRKNKYKRFRQLKHKNNKNYKKLRPKCKNFKNRLINKFKTKRPKFYKKCRPKLQLYRRRRHRFKKLKPQLKPLPYNRKLKKSNSLMKKQLKLNKSKGL